MEKSNMPDKIWATERDGEVYTTHDPKTVASVKAKGHKITEYIPASPTLEHAEELRSLCGLLFSEGCVAEPKGGCIACGLYSRCTTRKIIELLATIKAETDGSRNDACN